MFAGSMGPSDAGGVTGASTLQRPRLEVHLPEASFTLVVVDGPDRGLRFTLDGSQPSRPLIGQSPACDLKLKDRSVSRRHVALDLAGTRLRITDLNSTNGTFVNEIQTLDAYLQGGERVRLGETVFQVERHGAAVVPPLPLKMGFGQVIGMSVEMRRLYPLAERLATAEVPVIIEGETGTGKEVLAESLHELGPRASGPFVVFDCTAVPGNLLESELFGHEKGSFTGAIHQRKGVFEQAHGGTLFIDEIGDLELSLQPKLLRAIERREVRRVGGDKSIKVDVRILSATRRNLDLEVQAGRFRDDLFHRLAVARIELPPLRQRHGDVMVLAAHFARQMGAKPDVLTSEVLMRWQDSPWPGNVRELRNAVARFLSLGELGQMLELGGPRGPVLDGPDALGDLLRSNLPFTQSRQKALEIFERRYVERALAQHGGNVSQAAKASGLARRYFQTLKARSK